MPRKWPGLALIVLLGGVTQIAVAQDEAALLAALQDGNHVGLMRHSIAPGSDDPPNFALGDCSTQRNLSEGGRDQAVEIGARLREAGITQAQVMTSQWCRCRDTAELMNIGEVEELPSLNSLINYYGRGGSMTRDTAAWIEAADLGRPTILVTHQVNIGSLVRSGAEEGDIVVVRRDAGKLTVAGRLRLY